MQNLSVENVDTKLSYRSLVSSAASRLQRNNAGCHGFPPARDQWRPRGTTPRTPERNNTNEARRGRAPHPAAVAARVARDGRGHALPLARGPRPGSHAPPLRAHGRRDGGHERVARRAAPALLGGLRRARARGRRVAVLHGGARLRLQLGGREGGRAAARPALRAHARAGDGLVRRPGDGRPAEPPRVRHAENPGGGDRDRVPRAPVGDLRARVLRAPVPDVLALGLPRDGGGAVLDRSHISSHARREEARQGVAGGVGARRRRRAGGPREPASRAVLRRGRLRGRPLRPRRRGPRRGRAAGEGLEPGARAAAGRSPGGVHHDDGGSGLRVGAGRLVLLEPVWQ